MPAALMDVKFFKTFFKVPFSIEARRTGVNEKLSTIALSLLLLLARQRLSFHC